MNKLTLGKTLCLGMKGIHCVKRKEHATHSKMKDEGNEENLLLSITSIRLGIYLTRRSSPLARSQLICMYVLLDSWKCQVMHSLVHLYFRNKMNE